MCRKKRGRIQLVIVCLFLSGICLFSGCMPNKEKEEIQEQVTIDFTVCHDENLPKELKQLIEEKKEKPFKLSYQTKEYTYIATGYGQQTMGGYSVQVKALYELENVVVFKTTLKGPNPEEEKEGVSYPYIVVKIQNLDKTISFR